MYEIINLNGRIKKVLNFKKKKNIFPVAAQANVRKFFFFRFFSQLRNHRFRFRFCFH